MSVELAELAGFLGEFAPFDLLDEGEIESLVPKLTQRYHRRGEVIIEAGDTEGHLHVVRSGAVEVCDPDGVLLDTRDVGDSFGYTTISGEGPSRYRMVAVADTLTLLLTREAFDSVADRHPELREFFTSRSATTRSSLVEARMEASGGDALRVPVSELLARSAVTAPPSFTIREAASLMTELKVSSLVISDNDRVVGILTDRDFRTRVIAAEVDSGEPISTVMTPDPATVPADTSAFDATLVMMERSIHHLPVVDDGSAIGVVSATDLLRLAQADPVYLAGRIRRSPHSAEIARLVRKLPGLLVELADRNISADEVSRIVTATVDAATRRLLELAEAELGPPPVRYCWVALGSQARCELGIASDQDNALVLESVPEDDSWFVDAARRVTDGLAEAGFRLCPGDVMATNPEWRMTPDQWGDAAARWTSRPEADAVLDAQIFFDMRAVAGATELVDDARAQMLVAAEDSPRFLAYLAKGATDWRPPLGFFRGLVVEKRGEYRNTLDVKAGGITTIVQIARLHALSKGLTEVGTIERIEAAISEGHLIPGDGESMRAAFEELRKLQLRRHATCVREGREPDNNLEPSRLSARDRRHLRDSFKVIAAMLDGLALRFPIRHM